MVIISTPSTLLVVSAVLLVMMAVSMEAFSPPCPTIHHHHHHPSHPSTRSSTALNVAIDTSDIKNGMTIELDGEPHKVLSFSIMKQARGAAKTTIKFKNLMRGSTIENTYRSGEKFETAIIEKIGHQFTYQEGVSFWKDLKSFWVFTWT
jgi:Elongation factor P (EF-P) KOW-like domain